MRLTPGPGRFDTFGPAKALLNWPIEKVPQRELVGIVDFPVAVAARPARERPRCGCIGTATTTVGRGAQPQRRVRDRRGADPARPRLRSHFIADWLRSDKNQPPEYPFPIDTERARARQALYAEYCAGCHGARRTRFLGRQGRHGRADREYPHRSVPPRQLHACARGGAGQSVRRLSRRTFFAFPQDRRLRQPAARRHLAARAVSAQRLGPDRARPARTGRKPAKNLLSRLSM